MQQDTRAEEYRIISSFEMREEIESSPEPEIKYLSRIPSLDRAVEGFVPGELIVVSGPTKHGKTLFCQSLTVEFVKQNAFPLWFSFEVTPKYFLQAFPDVPLFYLPRKLKHNALNWVEGKVYEGFGQYHTRIVFIDHLHYLVDIARIRNPSLEIGTIIRRLKTLAVEGEFVIFLLCHTQKGASLDKDISYENIRDSSFVSQESDCVLLIRRNTEHPDSNQADLVVDFHRRTGVLRQTIHLVKQGGLLREEEWFHDDDNLY